MDYMDDHTREILFGAAQGKKVTPEELIGSALESAATFHAPSVYFSKIIIMCISFIASIDKFKTSFPEAARSFDNSEYQNVILGLVNPLLVAFPDLVTPDIKKLLDDFDDSKDLEKIMDYSEDIIESIKRGLRREQDNED